MRNTLRLCFRARRKTQPGSDNNHKRRSIKTCSTRLSYSELKARAHFTMKTRAAIFQMTKVLLTKLCQHKARANPAQPILVDSSFLSGAHESPALLTSRASRRRASITRSDDPALRNHRRRRAQTKQTDKLAKHRVAVENNQLAGNATSTTPTPRKITTQKKTTRIVPIIRLPRNRFVFHSLSQLENDSQCRAYVTHTQKKNRYTYHE